jgi:hypothetical protein
MVAAARCLHDVPDACCTPRPLLWHTMMSLDGFDAGPNDGMDWVFGIDGGDRGTIARSCIRRERSRDARGACARPIRLLAHIGQMRVSFVDASGAGAVSGAVGACAG